MAPSGPPPPPPLAAVEVDTGYHVKGHETHTVQTQLGPFSSEFLTGNHAYSSQPIFQCFGVGVAVVM